MRTANGLGNASYRMVMILGRLPLALIDVEAGYVYTCIYRIRIMESGHVIQFALGNLC